MDYKITVSEPWDFANNHGENIIKGKIIDIINEKMLIYKSTELIKEQGIENDYLVLSPRLKEDVYNEETLDHLSIEVNAYILKTKYNEKMDMDEIIYNSVFVIIGDLERL